MNDMRKLMDSVRPLFEDIEPTGKTAVGHVDDERDMLQKNARHIQYAAGELLELLEQLPEDADFPHWWQAKLVKAEDYLHTAKHYLENEMAFSQGDDHAHDDQEYDDDYQDPSGVS